MNTDKDNRSVKPRITHCGHGEKQLTLEGRIVFLYHAGIIPERFSDCKVTTLMLRTFLLTLLLVSISPPVQAEGEHARGEILSAYKSAATFATLDMGLQLSLDDQWYTYWRTPGDAGLAPVMDWTGSDNVKDVKILWPTPKRFTAFDMYSFGYDGTVILPLQVTPKKTGEAVTLKLKLDIVTCHEICIPQTLRLKRIIPAGNAERSDERQALTKAKDLLPSPENTKTLGMDTAVLGKDSIVVTAFAKEGFSSTTDLFVEAPGVIVTAIPDAIPSSGDGKRALIKMAGPEGVDLSKELSGKTVTITLSNESGAVERPFSF